MDYTEIKNKGLKELHEILLEKREELRSLRFKAHENQLKNVRAIRTTRLSIAQILTAIRMKVVSQSPQNLEPTK